MIRAYTLSVLLTMALLSGCTTMQQGNAASAPAETNTEKTDAQDAQQVRVDFRLAQAEPDSNLTKLDLPNDSGSIWHTPKPILTRADLDNVEPRRSQQGQAFVRFTLLPEAARKLADLTQRFRGKLLMLSMDNMLIQIQRINQPITNGVLDVPFDSDQQAIGLVNIIAGRAQLE